MQYSSFKPHIACFGNAACHDCWLNRAANGGRRHGKRCSELKVVARDCATHTPARVCRGDGVGGGGRVVKALPVEDVTC